MVLYLLLDGRGGFVALKKKKKREWVREKKVPFITRSEGKRVCKSIFILYRPKYKREGII